MVLSFVTGLLPAIVGSPASAVVYQCEPGAQQADVTNVVHHNKITHLSERISLAPGVGYEQTTTLSKTAQYMAGINGTVEVSAKVRRIVAELDGKVSATLAAAGTWTTTTSVTDKWILEVNKTDHQLTYVYYRGIRRYTGDYAYRVCNSKGSWGSWSYGYAWSWPQAERGWALCPSSRYGSNTLQYLATKAVGC